MAHSDIKGNKRADKLANEIRGNTTDEDQENIPITLSMVKSRLKKNPYAQYVQNTLKTKSKSQCIVYDFDHSNLKQWADFSWCIQCKFSKHQCGGMETSVDIQHNLAGIKIQIADLDATPKRPLICLHKICKIFFSSYACLQVDWLNTKH